MKNVLGVMMLVALMTLASCGGAEKAVDTVDTATEAVVDTATEVMEEEVMEEEVMEEEVMEEEVMEEEVMEEEVMEEVETTVQ